MFADSKRLGNSVEPWFIYFFFNWNLSNSQSNHQMWLVHTKPIAGKWEKRRKIPSKNGFLHLIGTLTKNETFTCDASSTAHTWAMKYAWLGLGSLCAFSFQEITHVGQEIVVNTINVRIESLLLIIIIISTFTTCIAPAESLASSHIRW